jgi:hypothetical protein
MLDSFDSEFNNLWRFLSTEDGVVLELSNPSPHIVTKLHANDSRIFVAPSLTLTCDETQSAFFELAAYQPFRAGPADVSFQLFCGGLLMTSDEKSGGVFLEDPMEAEHSHNGQIVNLAWEATPDADEAIGGDIVDVPQWLQEMLLA